MQIGISKELAYLENPILNEITCRRVQVVEGQTENVEKLRHAVAKRVWNFNKSMLNYLSSEIK